MSFSQWSAVVCDGCGGAVALKPGERLPRCLFCGASALSDYEPEGIEAPEGWIPFAVEDEAAQKAFAGFARSSIWYPGDLRRARLELQPLLLPAWAWSGTLESHWTGLEKASSASGKRPVGGAETVRFDQVLIPASKSLRLAELRALGAFDEQSLQPWDDAAEPEMPLELSEVTRSVARQQAQDEMGLRHKQTLAKAHGATGLKVASVSLDLEGRPVLVPVWIGAYRYGSKVYRVLVNGQSGQLQGEAPISWWRVGFAIALGAALLGFLVAMFSLCAGGGALVLR